MPENCNCLVKQDCQDPKISLIFEASLSGLNEVPPNDSTAIGYLVGILSPNKKKFRFVLHTRGLTNITAAHIHNAPVGQNGPIVKNIDIDPLTGRAVGVWRACDPEQPLTKDLVERLLNGFLYVNVHTLSFPNGEIRGQILLVNFNL